MNVATIDYNLFATLDNIKDQPVEYPQQGERRAEFVEQMLVKRREQILEALEETRLTFEEADELHSELAEIEVKL